MIYEFEIIVELKVSGSEHKKEMYKERGYIFGKSASEAVAALLIKYESVGGIIKSIIIDRMVRGNVLLERSEKIYEGC